MKRYPLAVVLFTVFVDLLGYGIVLPILPYHAQRFNAGPVQISAIIAAYSLMQFLFTPVWGRVADRVGRRPVILVSLFGSVASYLLFARAESALTVLVSRMLAGIGGANLSAAQAYMADVTTPESRARGMGWISAAFGLGYMLGPPIAALGADRWGVHAPGYIAGSLATLNLLLAWFALPESRVHRPPQPARRMLDLDAMRRVFTEPIVGPVALTMTVFAFATSGMTAMLALYLQGRFGFGATQAAWVFSMLGLTAAAVQVGLVHALVRSAGERGLVVGGLWLLALAAALLAAVNDTLALRVVMLVYALGFAVIGPSAMSLVSRATTARDQGQVIGVVQSLGSLARVFGPMLAGWSMAHLGLTTPFLAGSIVCALASVYMWYHLRREQPATVDVADRDAIATTD